VLSGQRGAFLTCDAPFSTRADYVKFVHSCMLGSQDEVSPSR